MKRVLFLVLPLLISGCNLAGMNVKQEDRQVVVRASCGLLASDCLAHPPMADLENAQSIARAIERIAVATRVESVAGQHVQVFSSMTITPPAGLASVRDLKRDKDAGEFVGNVVRYASNLSTPTLLVMQNAAQRDLANHLLRESRTTSVAVTVGDGKTITVKRQ